MNLLTPCAFCATCNRPLLSGSCPCGGRGISLHPAGSDELRLDLTTAQPADTSLPEICPLCNGEGHDGTITCPLCSGEGTLSTGHQRAWERSQRRLPSEWHWIGACFVVALLGIGFQVERDPWLFTLFLAVELVGVGLAALAADREAR